MRNLVVVLALLIPVSNLTLTQNISVRQFLSQTELSLALQNPPPDTQPKKHDAQPKKPDTPPNKHDAQKLKDHPDPGTPPPKKPIGDPPSPPPQPKPQKS